MLMLLWLKTKTSSHAKRTFKAFFRAICGLQVVFQKDVAFRQEILLTVALVPLALIFGITVIEKVILIGSWFLVLIMEIVNSSIELLVDRISLEIHPLSKKIKDASSAAVLLALINAIIIWAVILVHNFR